MISLNEWREFGFENKPSIKTAFQEKPYAGKNRVVRYLRKGRVIVPAAGVGRDVMTGKVVMPVKELRTDGEYCWNSMLEYYVMVYNMRLPAEFEQKAVKEIN